MVKKLEKYKDHSLATEIQMNYQAGMKAKDIALYFISQNKELIIGFIILLKKEKEEQN